MKRDIPRKSILMTKIILSFTSFRTGPVEKYVDVVFIVKFQSSVV